MTNNIEIKENAGKVVITIDTTKSFGPSQSGKTTIIATTGGSIKLADGSSMNLTVYRSRKGGGE